MRRACAMSMLVVGGLLAASCSDERSPLPTQPPLSPNFTSSATCPRPLELIGLMAALFSPRDLVTFALQMHNSINFTMSRGDVRFARKLVLAFIDFTVKAYYQGRLRDPIGIRPPITQKDAVIKLIDGLLCWVGLPPSGLTLGPPSPTGSPVTTKIIGPGGGDLKANDGLSALRVPAGTVSDDRLWVITRRDDLAQAGTCVTTALDQVPLCIDFSVVPAQPLAHPVLVVICQVNSHEGLQLAHQLPEGKVELLAPQADPFALACPHTPSFAPPGLGRVGRAVWRLGSFVARVLGPEPAYASHTGLGGLVAPKLSDITAVRVRLGFVQQPMNTTAGAAIAPPVTVAFLKVGTEGDVFATEVTNRIHVRIGTDPSESATLSGTTTQTPTNGVATFADLSIDKTASGYTLEANALSPEATGSVPLGISVRSIPFDVVSGVDLVTVNLSSTTLTIRSSEGQNFNVPYTASILNSTGTTLSVVFIQAYIDQGTAHRGANGSNVTCGLVSGALPPGTCPFSFTVGASNIGSGTGILVPGPATAVFELRRFDNATNTQTLLDTFTVPVTLVSPISIAGGTYSDRAQEGVIGTAFLFDPSDPSGPIDAAVIHGPAGWNTDSPVTCGRYQPPGTASTRAICWVFTTPLSGDYSAQASLPNGTKSGHFTIDATSILTPPTISSVTPGSNQVTIQWSVPTGTTAQAFLVRVNPLDFSSISGEMVVSGATRSATLTGLTLSPRTQYQAVVFAFDNDVLTPGPLGPQFNVGAHGVLFTTP